MKVSVIIPCFKSGRYVLEAVDSVLNQKGESHLLEVIIIDDHNDDPETLDALELLRNGYSNNDIVKVIENINERGPGAARNCGIRYAQGDWIAFLDADDKYSEYSLDVRCKAAEQYPQCGWIGADFSIWQNGKEIKEISFFRNKFSTGVLKEVYQLNREVIVEEPMSELLCSGLTNTISSMIRKELIEKIGGFDNSFRLQQDYHLFLRLSRISTGFVFVPKICAFYRQHSNNSTKSDLNTAKWRIKVLESLLSEKSFQEYRSIFLAKIAKHYLGLSYGYREIKDYSEARRMALYAIRFDLLNFKNWKCLLASLIRA